MAPANLDPDIYWELDHPPDTVRTGEREPLRPLGSNVRRAEVFGSFRWVSANSPRDPEAIRILGDWVQTHTVQVHIPQLAHIPGIVHRGKRAGAGPRSGMVQCHRLIERQLKCLWQAWDDAGLLELVITWGGMWVPRLIRQPGRRPHELLPILSNHAFATAFDINVPWNQMGREPAPSGARGSVLELVPLAERHGFFWGGHFARRDGMHFEAAEVQ
jgi:hypothetical protein